MLLYIQDTSEIFSEADMNKHLKVIFAVAVVAVTAACIGLYLDDPDSGGKGKTEVSKSGIQALGGLDPDSYDAGYTVLGISAKEIQLAPANYDGDEKEKYAKYIKTYELSPDAAYYSGEARSSAYADGHVEKTVKYSGSSYEELKESIALNGWDWAYVWFDSSGRVKYIMVYGETRYYR